MQVLPMEARVRQALSATSETPPRPLCDLELPFALDRWLGPGMTRNFSPAAVLVPLLRREEGLSILLTRRADTLRSHGGQISFPGGRRDETDRSAAENALREAEEEVGLDPAGVDIIGYLDDYPTVTRYLVTPVVGVASGPFSWRVDAAEVAEIFEIPLALALDVSAYQRKSLVRQGIKLPFLELPFGDYRIWGATAGMLYNLARQVARHG